MRRIAGVRPFAAVIVVVAGLGVALLVLAVDLPGPSLGEVLGSGDADDPLNIEPCTPSADNVLLPGERHMPTRWRRAGRMPVARDELRAAAVGRRVYVVGALGRRPDGRLRSEPSLFILDARTGNVARGPDVPLALDHAAVASDGRDIWAAGGFSNFEARGEVFRYSPRTRRWTLETHLRLARGGGGAGFIDGRLYVVGGAPPTLPDPDQEPYAALESFDPRSGRWTPGPDMPTARHHLATAVLDGKLYVIGGRSGNDFSLAAVERYDPKTNEWSKLPPLPKRVGGPAAAVVDGRIVVTGGGDERELWVTPATWAFDPDTGRWSRLPDLNVARHGEAAAAVGSRVFAVGGSPCPGFGHTATIESLTVR